MIEEQAAWAQAHPAAAPQPAQDAGASVQAAAGQGGIGAGASRRSEEAVEGTSAAFSDEAPRENGADGPPRSADDAGPEASATAAAAAAAPHGPDWRERLEAELEAARRRIEELEGVVTQLTAELARLQVRSEGRGRPPL